MGTAAYEEVADAADRILGGEHTFKCLEDIDKPMKDENGKLRVLSTAPYFAYLKISEGCDNHCTYCVIPKMRGKHRSRTMESLVEEAEILAKQGVKELVIVAQDTSIYGRDLYGEPKLHELLEKLAAVEGIQWIRLLYCYPETLTQETIQDTSIYGRDLYGEPKLHELLEKLAAVEGIQWIRLLYCYPETLTQETIDVMAKNEKICHYIDMPIQHGCDTVLKRMGRKSSQELIRQTVKKLRDAMPDIAIRTTLIVGFPGETEEEFADLQKFVEEMRFDRLGVFCYSQEEGTPAAKMENQIDDEVKEERQRIIMDIQKNIAASLCQQEVGKTLEVLVEGKLPEENVYCGRTRWDAPDIDGMVFFHAEEEAYSGDFVSVKIKEAGDYDLMGDVVYADEFTE